MIFVQNYILTKSRNRDIIVSEREVKKMYKVIDFLLSLDNDNIVKDYDVEYYNDDTIIITFYCEINEEKFVKKFELRS